MNKILINFDLFLEPAAVDKQLHQLRLQRRASTEPNRVKYKHNDKPNDDDSRRGRRRQRNEQSVGFRRSHIERGRASRQLRLHVRLNRLYNRSSKKNNVFRVRHIKKQEQYCFILTF